MKSHINFQPKHFVCFCFFLYISTNAICQLNTPPNVMLTKTEMQEDFSFLMSVMNDVNPQIPFRTMLTGVNPTEDAKTLFQNEISEVKSFEDYYYLIHKVLSCMHDQHCKIYDVPDFLQTQLKHIPQISFKKNSEYIEKFDRYSFGGLFDLKFINGKYYTVSDYWGKNNSFDSTFLPAGSAILKMNGKLVHEILNSHIYLTPSSRWDFINKTYISTSLFHPNEYNLGDTICLSVKLPNSDITKIDFSDKNLFTTGFLYSDYFSFKVQYLPNNILYIRVPEMNLEKYDYLKEKIVEIKNRKLSKIVIDIRDNQGGNDSLWIKLLGLLVKSPLEIKSDMVVKKTNRVINYLEEYEGININHTELYNHQLLPNNEVYVKLPNSTISIEPDKESLRFDGTTYLLVNDRCYSSSLAFLSAIRGLDNFISVGQSSGWFGGRGLTPFFYSMPHSNIIFSIEPVIDLTGVADINQVLQDMPDIEINLSIEDYIMENSYKGERFSEDFLFNYDPTFQSILKN